MTNQSTAVSLKTLKKFVVAPNQTIEGVRMSLTDINDQIKVLNAAARRPQFAFENSFDQVQPELEKLQAQRFSLEKEEIRLTMTSRGYPEELDYTPLGWLKKGSLLPALFIVNIRDNAVCLQVTHCKKSVTSFNLCGEYRNWIGQKERRYPEIISNLYKEAAQCIADNYDSYWEQTTIARAQFQGVLPEATRNKIKQAIKSRLFDDIFVIAEAKDWSVRSILVAKNDPYVVGWVNRTNQMFIIDFFDPTPLEVYIKEQHTI